MEGVYMVAPNNGGSGAAQTAEAVAGQLGLHTSIAGESEVKKTLEVASQALDAEETRYHPREGSHRG